MKINRDNFEAYFLDYHEGQLSPEMVEEVLWFVEHNPDAKEIFNEFEAVSLIGDPTIVFEKKSSLKKNEIYAASPVNELNYEEFLISETEGLLNIEQGESLNKFIGLNPQFAIDRKLFSLTHLAVENEIVFADKESLKKSAIPVGAITADTYDNLMARELEGDLTESEKTQFDEFMLYNPHLEQDHKLYQHTILQAEIELVYSDKSSLKRSAIPNRRIVYYALSVAASLALLVSVYLNSGRVETQQSIAKQGGAGIVSDKQTSASNNLLPANPIDINKTKSNSTVRTDANVLAANRSGNPKTDKALGYPAFSKRTVIEELTTRPANKITTHQFVDPQFTFIRSSQMYMNTHLELYYNLKLSEEIQYAQVNATDQNPAKTIFGAASAKADKFFAFKHEKHTQEEKKNLTGWTFAELGVQTFNTLTSSELQLNLHKDDEGKVVAYGFENGLIDFERQVKK